MMRLPSPYRYINQYSKTGKPVLGFPVFSVSQKDFDTLRQIRNISVGAAGTLGSPPFWGAGGAAA